MVVTQIMESLVSLYIQSVYIKKPFKPVYTKAFKPVYTKAFKPVYTQACQITPSREGSECL